MGKIFSIIVLFQLLVSCAVIMPKQADHRRSIKKGDRSTVSSMHFVVDEKKTRIVLALSSKCSEDETYRCNYKFIRDGDDFSLVMKGASYTGEGNATVSPEAEIKKAYIEDVSGGIELKGTLSEYAGKEEVRLLKDPYRITIDVFRKTDQESQAEEKIQAKYTEEEKTQSVALLDMRYGKHADRTRVVFDLSDSCVWTEEDTPEYIALEIKGASTKIKQASSGTLGSEVKSVSLGAGDGKIKLSKASSGGKAVVELLEPKDGYPYYRLLIDVFALKEGQTKQQLYSSAMQYAKADESDEEDLNQYDELVPLSDKYKNTEDETEPEQTIDVSDADIAAVGNIAAEENNNRKFVIVVDPGHGGKFGGAQYQKRKILRYKEVQQFKKVKRYKIVRKKNGRKTKVLVTKNVPLTKTIIKNGKKRTIKVTKKVPEYQNIGKPLREQDLTLMHAKAVKEYFEGQPNSPFKVILTREIDKELGRTTAIDLATRNKIADANNAAAFVSMHINSVAEKKCANAHGFEIIYTSMGKNTEFGNTKIMGRDLALAISKNLKNKAGIPQYKEAYEDKSEKRGKGKSIYVLKAAKFPAVLIESGYICNEKDRQYMQDSNTVKKMAEAIYSGLIEYGKKAGWKGVK